MKEEDYHKRLAKEQGYLSRAAFKLLEIDNRYKIFKKGQKILDLGAAPGSWSQVAAKKSKNSLVVAVDVQPVSYTHGNIQILKCDINDSTCIDRIKNFSLEYDLILSDISPEFSGIKQKDIGTASILNFQTLEIAKQLLIKKGTLVIKVFQGPDLQEFENELKQNFQSIKRFKPKSSPKKSSEFYLIAKNKK